MRVLYCLNLFVSDSDCMQVDSLRYLRHCAVKYGEEKMARHTEAIWSLLKEAIYKTPLMAAPSFDLESVVGLGFQENEVASEALKVLEDITRLDNVCSQV